MNGDNLFNEIMDVVVGKHKPKRKAPQMEDSDDEVVF